MIRYILDRVPYIGGLRAATRAAGSFAPGHFYSPVPSPQEIATRLKHLSNGHSGLAGIRLDDDRQLCLLEELKRFYRELPFPEQPTESCRYYFNQTSFCSADAIFLYSMLRRLRPRRVIEVGSGFSSAVILDTVERFLPERPELTFIEPYPTTLKRLLRPDDRANIELIEDKVQAVAIDTFASLTAGDLLFIDSSHVVKCGSDVQFLLFDILPRLAPGVVVHFHDVFDSFEYPAEWLMKGWYWNEDYMLRAFLSYNDSWEIELFGNYCVRRMEPWFADNMPLCLRNPGGSLYIRRTK